jgi:hypothetical protein
VDGHPDCGPLDFLNPAGTAFLSRGDRGERGAFSHPCLTDHCIGLTCQVGCDSEADCKLDELCDNTFNYCGP